MININTSRNKGQGLVELALLLPIFLLILMIIFDLGRVVYYYSVVYNAAREGARYGIVDPNESSIEAHARDYLTTGVDLNPKATVDLDAETVNVVITTTFTTVTPLLLNLTGSDKLILSSESTMYIEPD